MPNLSHISSVPQSRTPISYEINSAGSKGRIKPTERMQQLEGSHLGHRSQQPEQTIDQKSQIQSVQPNTIYKRAKLTNKRRNNQKLSRIPALSWGKRSRGAHLSKGAAKARSIETIGIEAKTRGRVWGGAVRTRSDLTFLVSVTVRGSTSVPTIVS
jgi:hypothetical protein